MKAPQHETGPGSTARIALVSGGLALGGATTFLCNLAGELVARGYPVQVFSLELDNRLAADFERLRIPVQCWDHHRLILEDRLELLLRELRSFQPDAVVANLGAVSFEILRYVPPGVIRAGAVQSHDPGVYRMVKAYAGHLDWLAAVSQTIRGTLQSMPEFSNVPVHYLPYGVPMPEKTRVIDPAARAPLRIIYLGRLSREQKRVHLFPAILDRLRASGIPFHWTIAGEGPEQDWLRVALKSASPNQTVSFIGPVSYAQVPRTLLDHHIFLLASDYEGLPLSLLEAMGCGLVPVVSDLVSGIREVVDASTGELIAPDNTAGYAERIIALHKDRSRMKDLSQNAIAQVRRDFSVAAMTDRWVALLARPTVTEKQWPTQWRIKAPLASRGKMRFSPPARALRRWKYKLKSWNGAARRAQ